jgi:GNAT superfamily N-acetyltransferase
VSDARLAVETDISEVIRLRAIMLNSMDGLIVPPGPWEDSAGDFLAERLQENPPTLAAYVVDQPDHPGFLAACAVGTIEHRLGGPANPSGAVGYVFNVATDPLYRRRGYSRGCMEALLAWFVDAGVRKIDLKASREGEPLYTSLGFRRTDDPAMRLTLPDERSDRDRTVVPLSGNPLVPQRIGRYNY